MACLVVIWCLLARSGSGEKKGSGWVCGDRALVEALVAGTANGSPLPRLDLREASRRMARGSVCRAASAVRKVCGLR